MVIAALAIVIGLIVIVWSADWFINGSVGLAYNLGMSKALIGLTIVALGTSAPEIVVAIMAALTSTPILAYGNAIGSNIANIGLVLGATTLITSLPVKRGLIREDLPLLIGVSILVAILASDLHLNRADGFIMLFALCLLLAFLVRYKKEHQAELVSSATAKDLPTIKLKRSLWLLMVGLTLLIASSRLLVWGAEEIARALEVSELVIGLTIIAIGTSLPELATSLVSALKQHHDIAIGNIIGSNILNLLAALPAAAMIEPIELESSDLLRDYGSMSLITVTLALFILIPKKNRALSTREGMVLLTGYLIYMAVLYQQTVNP